MAYTNKEKQKHEELVTWGIRGAITILVFAMWYFAQMAIKTKDEFIEFKKETELNISNEISRSKAKDETQQKEIDKNTAHREDPYIRDNLTTLIERTKNLHKDDGS